MEIEHTLGSSWERGGPRRRVLPYGQHMLVLTRFKSAGMARPPNKEACDGGDEKMLWRRQCPVAKALIKAASGIMCTYRRHRRRSKK